jgi:hypothetical protein
VEKRFEIEFAKGGRFTAVLLTEEAPKTCAAFLKVLPFAGQVRQARFSGEECYLQSSMSSEPENQQMPHWGDIAFNADPKWRAVCIYYGDHLRVRTPYNLFARIISNNLEELKRAGERVWLQGEEAAEVKLIP